MSGTYNIGLKVIKKLVQEGDSLSWYKTKLREELFKGIEVDVFKWAEAHLQKYFDLPKLPTLEAQFPDVVEVDCPEPPAYYIDLLEKRYFHGLINAANIESQQILKDDKDAWAASQNVMEKALLKINEQKYSRKILNVGQDAPKLLIDAYHHHGYNDDAVIFGWPYLDDMCGGLQGGDVASFVGRPAAGKSWLSLFSGLVNWRKGHNVLFVSMEMTALAVAQRLGSMFTEVPIKQVKMGNLPSMAMFSDKDGKPVAVNSKYKQFVDGLHKMKEAPGEFQIVDGNLAANVDDIYLIANRLKSSLVIVDGGYLVRNPNPKLDRFTRVAENVEAMKRHSTDLNIPTLASWQFNRTASSKGKGQLKGQKAGLDDIGYSDAIGQISSIVLGLFQDEGIETINKRRLDLLKGRNGEVGNFSINWLFDVMNFHEAQEEEGDLQNV